MSSLFQEFPKIPRLSREIVISEKIDGINASIIIVSDDEAYAATTPLADVMKKIADNGKGLVMFAGTRSQLITPDNDTHGFAKWVSEHADELFTLGPGTHFGEWWGSGIRRGYGLPQGEKRFSLFNVARWGDERNEIKYPTPRPACCHVTPVLYRGPFDTQMIDYILTLLRSNGSTVSPGFARPEGVIIFHTAGNLLFKKTIEKDSEPKSKSNAD